MRVYLSGGFRSGWQDEVARRLADNHELVDPRAMAQDTLPETFREEMQEISNCDAALAYVEPGRCPIGLGR